MPPEDDIRSAIESAVNQHEAPPPAEAPPPSQGDTSTPAAPVPAPAAATPAAAPAETPAAPAPAPSAGQQASPASPPAAADTAQKASAPPPPAPDSDPLSKPPGSWTPTAREKWTSVDPELRQEIWRRERETTRALTASADARRFQSEFVDAVQPFMGFIAAEKSTPIQAMVNMFQTAAALRVGTPQQKVQLVADIIRTYSVDLPALDSVLAGQEPRYNPQALIQQEIARALQPYQQQQQMWEQQRTQQEAQINSSAATELQQFAETHEFFEDVKDVMADLLTIAMQRNQQMSLTDAYERATLMVEPVRRVIESRKQAEAARAQSAKAQQARNAAGSITPSAETATTHQVAGDSIRSALEFAISQQQGR